MSAQVPFLKRHRALENERRRPVRRHKDSASSYRLPVYKDPQARRRAREQRRAS
jgi:hypothetical protein